MDKKNGSGSLAEPITKRLSLHNLYCNVFFIEPNHSDIIDVNLSIFEYTYNA